MLHRDSIIYNYYVPLPPNLRENDGIFCFLFRIMAKTVAVEFMNARAKRIYFSSKKAYSVQGIWIFKTTFSLGNNQLVHVSTK